MNRSIKLNSLSTAILAFTLCACSQTPSQATKHNTVNKTEPKLLDVQDIKPTDLQQVSEANNQFAIDFYKLQTKKNRDKNLFFSPYSLSTALAMTYEGATGQTAHEMAKVMHFPEKDVLRRGHAGIYNQINTKNKPYALNTANALWLQTGFEIKPRFTQDVSNFYGGDVTNLDFQGAPAESAKTINHYIETQTQDKIKKLVTADLISSAKLVLTNAMYFNGTWANTFDPDFTKDMPFHLASGKSVDTPFMTQLETHFNYYENDKLQILSMPYKGYELSMLVLLPKKGTSISKTLTSDNLKTWRNQFSSELVNLYLPKFKLEQSYKLAKDLETMGMPSAFSDDAEFHGISQTPLKISEVIHKAFVDVNEEGTEAAAATAVIMAEAASIEPELPEPKEFKADRPFVFMIQQNDTGNILFMGRVSNLTNVPRSN